MTFEMARLRLAQGRAAEALAEIRKALKIDPKNRGYLQLKKEILKQMGD